MAFRTLSFAPRLGRVAALLLLLAGLGFGAAPAQAQSSAAASETTTAEVDALYEALGLPEMIGIMRDEGLEYGATIAEDLFGGRGGAEWEATVARIYDAGRMDAAVRAGLARALQGADAEAIAAFFTSDTGRRIVGLEVSARRALLDDAVEEASKEAAALAIADETPLAERVARFIEANDLIETNVVGALNSNYAFYRGLAAGGALPGEMTEEDMLADVWAQEPEIRDSTTEWVRSFLIMAYQPLPPEDLESYIAFSGTEAGQRLNQALFAAFDGLFEEISMALGAEAARFMAGQDI